MEISIDSKAYLLGVLILSVAVVLIATDAIQAVKEGNARELAALKFSCPCESNGGACVQKGDVCYAAGSMGLNWNRTRPFLIGQANATRALKMVC
jgi:hypothetical protein